MKENKLSSFLISYSWLILSLILIFGIFVRFYRLGSVPISLYWDEVAMLVDARVVADTGQDMYGYPAMQAMFISYGDFKLPVYIWLATQSVQLFGTNNWALRFPSAIVGVFQILSLFVLAKELMKWQKISLAENENLSKLYAISAACVLAIAPWSILFSRTGFESHIGQFLVTISVIFLLKARQRSIFYIPAVLLGALAVYSYYSVRFVWPVLCIGILFLDVIQTYYKSASMRDLKQKVVNHKGTLLIPIVALVVWFLLLTPLTNSPYYEASQQYRLSAKSILNVFDLPLQSNVYREWTGNTIFSRLFYHRHWLLMKELANNYAEHMGLRFIFLEGDSNLRHSTYAVGLFVFGFIPIFLIGFFNLFLRYWKIWSLVCLWWMIALLPASVPEEIPHALRSLNALTPLTLIIGFGLVTIIQHTFIVQKVKWKKIVTIFLFGFITLQTTLFLHDYFSHYPIRSATDWQGGYEELARYVHQEKGDYDEIIIDAGDGRMYLWFLAYGNYSGQIIQSFEYNDYSLTKIEHIIFKEFQWENFELLNESVMIVTKHSQLPEFITPKTTIHDAVGIPRFDIVVVE